MNCNGIRPRIFVVYFLMIALLHTSSCQQKQQQKQKDYDAVDSGLVGTKGDLYEVFKKRLEKFNSEMSLNADGLFDEKRVKTHIADEKRSTVRECLYEEYKKRLDKINNELSLDGEKVFDRSGRNTNKETAASNGPTAITSKIEDIPRAPIEDNLPPVAPENIVKKKNAEIETQGKPLSSGSCEKSQHKVDEEVDIQNKDLKKLQTNGIVEENTALDKKTNNKIDNGENADKQMNIAKLIMPAMQLNNAKLLSAQNNEPDFKDKASNVFRRQTEETTADKSEHDVKLDEMSAELIPTDLSPSYPSVLTKGLNPNITPGQGAHIAPSSLLNSVASKLKTSPLDLAKKLATATDGSTNIKNDPKLTKLLQKYIENSVNLNSNGRTAKDTAADAALTGSLCMPQDLPHYQIAAQPQNSQTTPQAQCPLTGPVQTLEYNSVSNILEKVLSKLEQIQESKPDNMSDKFCEVEGAPCEVLGIWNSYVMGLKFGIRSGNASKRRFDAKCAEPENLVLSIDVQETNPPKLHQIMDTGWKFTGSSMKQLGGPFFIISETRTQNVLATFAGYCRTCGSIDTIFGSWTFVFPSKDCQDITVSIENKRDIFRRDLLDAKIGERYNSATNCDKGKKGKCLQKHK